MSDLSNEQGEGDWGYAQRDLEQQADADVNLDDPTSTDNVPWSPPDRQPRGAELVGAEEGRGETIEQRILQEEPEEGTAYGAPDSRGEADDQPGAEEPAQTLTEAYDRDAADGDFYVVELDGDEDALDDAIPVGDPSVDTGLTGETNAAL